MSSFIICTVYDKDDEIKEYELRETYSTYGKIRNA
jgi:hypothetical protein